MVFFLPPQNFVYYTDAASVDPIHTIINTYIHTYNVYV